MEKEIAIIEYFIELGYDMIIADPQNAEALEDVFKRGKEAGTLMVSLRSPMKNTDYNCLISHYDGFYGVSYAAFEILGGKGQVLLIQGQIGYEAFFLSIKITLICSLCLQWRVIWLVI